MDTKVLRQKILDLAIRDKLVPQDPDDEPASVLLERIRAEKQQMVKDGKLKVKDIKNDTIIFKGEDNLHYEKFQDDTVKCIEDEIPFEVPEGWAWCRLKSLAAPHENSFVDGPFGSNLKKEHYTEAHEVRIIQLNNIGELSWKNNGVKYTTFKHAETLKRCISYPGDIVIAKMMPAGRAVIIPNIEKIYVISSDCVRLQLPEYINTEYVMYMINSDIINNSIMETVQGIGRSRTSLGKLKEILVPLPCLKEQQHIVKKIVKLLESITNINESISDITALINTTKNKILDLAIRGKLVPQDPNDEPASILLERIRSEKEELIKQGKIKCDKKESIIFKGDDNSYYEKMPDGKVHCIDSELPFELPNGWEWCNLSMIGITNIGLTYHPADIKTDGVIVLRSCNIVNNQIDLNNLVRVKADIRDNQYVQENDILICARNGSKALVGKCALIPKLEEPVSFGAFMAIYRTEFYEYILHYLHSNLFRSVFDDGNSTAINQLTQDMLKRAVVPLPTLAEQRRIAITIDLLISEMNCIEKNLN